jgi:hypothetical protein
LHFICFILSVIQHRPENGLKSGGNEEKRNWGFLTGESNNGSKIKVLFA